MKKTLFAIAIASWSAIPTHSQASVEQWTVDNSDFDRRESRQLFEMLAGEPGSGGIEAALAPIPDGAYGGIIGIGGAAGNQGGISITTTSTGLYTIKGKAAGFSFSHKGEIQPDRTVSEDFTISLFGGFVKIPVHLQFAVSDTAEKISGTATIKDQPFSFELHRAFPYTVESPAPQAGRHTALFSPNGSNPDVPGRGIATITVSPKGLVKVIGTLGDGSKISCGGSVSQTGVFPILNVLYGRKGALAGFAQFGATDAGTENNKLSWLRIVSKSDPTFVFNGKLDVELHAYIPPAPGTPAVTLTADSNTVPLFLHDGGIANYTPANVTLSNENKFTVQGENPSKIKLSLNKITGLVTGTVVIETSTVLRKRPLRLVILQELGIIEGFFIGVESTGTAEISIP